MPRTVDIPGGHATLRTLDEITERNRRPITATSFAASDVLQRVPPDLQKSLQAATTPEQMAEIAREHKLPSFSADDFMLVQAMQDASILAFLRSWTLPRPIPASLSEVQDLPPDVYDALSLATQNDATALAQQNFGVNPDQSSPTSPSSDSNGSLREEALPTSTSLPATAPLAGGGSSREP